VILGVLGLIDLAFTGNLIVIVIFSGFEHPSEGRRAKSGGSS